MYVRELRHDAAYTVRQMRRAPGFALTAIATLALGIGATTAVFTVISSVLLRPLRFADAERLVMIRPSSGSRVSDGYLHDWRMEATLFQDIAGWQDGRANLTGGDEPIEVLADRATTNFFSVLGTPPVLGRTFTTTADLSRVEPEVVLSYDLWHRRYGGDSAVIGRPLTLDGESFTIIGVMPRGFAIPTTERAESRTDLWITLRLAPADRTGMGGPLHAVGRLSPGATIAAAESDLLLISRRIEEQFPSYSRDWRAEAVPLLEATVRDVRPTLLVLFGGVAILLLITCGNVANLVLGRGMRRTPELVVRVSLGATGPRLVRQLLNESLALACIGGAAGVVVGAWGTPALVSLVPAGLDLPRVAEIGVDARVLAVACAATLVTVILFGVAPALQSVRAVAPALTVATGRASSAPGQFGLAGALVIAEVALAVGMLAAAGLLVRSFAELTRVDPGFSPTGALTMRTTLSASKYDTDDRVRAFGRELLLRLERVPALSAAGFANYLPLSRFGAAHEFDTEGRADAPDDEPTFSWVSIVGGRYFEAMGMRLMRGRLPGNQDTERTTPVFVIDETLARRHWPDADPVGARLVWNPGGDASFTGEVIGVVSSVRWQGLAAEAPATAYWWFPQAPTRDVAIVARTAGDPASHAAAIAAQVSEIDRDQPIAEVRPLQDLVSDDLARTRFTMLLLGGFATASLVLTAIGLYGVVASSIARRTRELGIRIALGAQPREIFWLVSRRGMLLVGWGSAIGLATALGAGRAVANLLHGVTPADAPTLLVTMLFVLAVAAIASYVPARRATRIDPIASVRTE